MFAHHTDRFMTEKELIVSLKQGDEAAFTALYRMYWPKKFTTFPVYTYLL